MIELSTQAMVYGQPGAILAEDLFKPARVLVIGLHPDEDLAPNVAREIYTNRPDLAPFVDYVYGNPMAAAAGRLRYLDTDLNRSFWRRSAYLKRRAARRRVTRFH